MKAVSPREMPPIPEGANGWRRSTRAGSMYHAHSLGYAVCKSIYMERHKSEDVKSVGDMQFWGVCPRCYAKAMAKP